MNSIPKILSIVVPAYNMEKYLSRCVDSIINNSNGETLEVIIVNDGSKDNSLNIAKEYANNYPDTIIVIDKPNGNYGSCINKALQISSGKYFRIVDADDWVNSKGMEDFIELLKTTDADAVFTHYTSELLHKNKTFEHRISVSEFLNQKIDEHDFNILKKMNVWEDFAMHKITYRTQLLKNIGFYHTEGISYTDSEYVFYPISYLESVYLSDIFLYRYFVGREGQTISAEAQIKTVSQLRTIIDRMLTVDLNSIQNDTKKKWAIDYLSFIIAGYYHRILILQNITKSNSEVLRSFDDELKYKSAEVYRQLDKVSIKGIKWLSIWRRYNIQIIKPDTYKMFVKWFKRY